MGAIFFIVGFVAAVFGGLVLKAAQGAIHEIEAMLAFLVGAVLMVGGTLIDRITTTSDKVRAELKSLRSVIVSRDAASNFDDSARR